MKFNLLDLVFLAALIIEKGDGYGLERDGHDHPKLYKHHDPCGSGDFFVTPYISFFDADNVCQKYGGVLAELDNQTFLKATDVAFDCNGPYTESWIRSYNGDSHQDACLVLSTGSGASGGAVNLPANCRYRRRALCTRKGHRSKRRRSRHCPSPPTPPIPPKPPVDCGCNCNCRYNIFGYRGDELPSIGPEGQWSYYSLPSLNFTADDADLSIYNERLIVDSYPFTLTTTNPQDHIKFLLFTNQQFNVPERGEIALEATISSARLGLTPNPFGSQVLDAESDPRLAAVALVVLDADTGIVFDFFITNDKIYALYERLDSARLAYGDYGSFTQAIPVANTTINSVHAYAILINGQERSVRWLVDGEEVYKAYNIGQIVSREFMLVDRAGQPEFAFPKTFSAGFGTFDLLDGYSACNVLTPTLDGQRCVYPADEIALVQLRDGERNARNGFTPAQFVSDGTDPAYRLWGQGAIMAISNLTVGYCDQKYVD
jgi:hypothetical protein